MPIKVLVVDDSSFFRRRVSEIIDGDKELEVIGTANNGKEAIEQTLALKPDVITMDIEMPVMDGITAVREIMAKCPTNILMFSSLTHEGAKATLDALEAGALDFLPKKFEDIARNRDDAVELLLSRIRQLGKQRTFRRAPSLSQTTTARTSSITPSRKPADRPSSVPSSRFGAANKTSTERTTSIPSREAVKRSAVSAPVRSKPYRLLAIGTSTGGPVALQKVLTELPGNYPVPIIIIQHMPGAFTPAFATRLNNMCAITVKEAENGDILRPAHAYLAPGGTQMLVEGSANQAKLKVMKDDSSRLTYKPSVDVSFGSAAKIYGDGVLAVVLTGMGADGREGSRLLKKAGSTIWAQDEASCVVYGMPQAVASAGISEMDIPLDEIGGRIKQHSCR
ncbi:chemotaxis-specific protein-glutamate methyltransferase CheB [Catenovulum sp. SM1970]|uniref:protein-glutamate methylesterase/protein-glutamine glutaminase n=1 Tax=Marinifaba aquimaris TaxID=2741323 RepID=UPI0015726333|nr:chemotaxis response regulator protein-glutamate methylesterase [Marinifaba aquimaris]NTS76374.1 chemotaxis-specific protein-glutamate methyltransferase CheB [Marinifaba aquimaris]